LRENLGWRFTFGRYIVENDISEGMNMDRKEKRMEAELRAL
jgi:hypothetical protein